MALGSFPAAAQRGLATTAVASSDSLDSDAALAAHALQTFALNDPRFAHVSLAAHALGDTDARTAKTEDGKRVLAEAVEAFDHMSYAPGLAKASQAAKLFEEGDLSAGAEGLFDAIAARTLVLFAKNDKPEFRNEVLRLLAMRPDYQWDPKRLTPPAAAAIEPLRKKVSSSAPATLEVQSTPPGALAFVDGVFRGVTPVKVSLMPGSHYVTLSAAGFELAQERVFAGSGPGASIPLVQAIKGRELLAMLQELKAAVRRGDAADQASRLARWAKVDELLLGRVEQSGAKVSATVELIDGEGKVFASATRELASRGPASLSEWDALAREVCIRLPDKPSKPEARAPGDLPELGGESGGPSRSTWGLAAGGVGLACAAGGLVVGLSAQAKAQEANRTPQPRQTEYQQRAAAASSQALLADVLYGVGAVGLVAGAWLLIGADDEPVVLFAPTHGGAAVSMGGTF